MQKSQKTVACRIHTKPFHPEWLGEKMDSSKVLLPENCTDTEPACPAWAASGGLSKEPCLLDNPSLTAHRIQ